MAFPKGADSPGKGFVFSPEPCYTDSKTKTYIKEAITKTWQVLKFIPTMFLLFFESIVVEAIDTIKKSNDYLKITFSKSMTKLTAPITYPTKTLAMILHITLGTFFSSSHSERPVINLYPE